MDHCHFSYVTKLTKRNTGRPESLHDHSVTLKIIPGSLEVNINHGKKIVESLTCGVAMGICRNVTRKQSGLLFNTTVDLTHKL